MSGLISSVTGNGRVDLDKLGILIRRMDHLSPAIAILSKMRAAIERASTPVDLTEVISECPELAMRTLRLANCAAFGSRNVESLRHAVELLGWQRVYSLAVTVSITQESDLLPRRGCIMPDRYQKRSVAIAHISKIVASRVDPLNQERHYVSGLLQEWGYLLLAKYLPHILRPIAATIGKDPTHSSVELERFYLGTDHAEIGSLAVEEYGLGDDLANGIKFHHAPDEAPEDYVIAADIAHVASWLAGELGLTVFENELNHELWMSSLIRLDWTVEKIENLKSAIASTVHCVSDNLSPSEQIVPCPAGVTSYL